MRPCKILPLIRTRSVDRRQLFPATDIAETQSLTLWGSNCAATMPAILPLIMRQRVRGTLIAVDPRRTETALLADLHLQLTPGTDLTLANGLLFLAIELGLIDRGYIAAHTTGFDALRREVLGYDPVHVERVTGVPQPDLVRAVRRMATLPSSMLLSGGGTTPRRGRADVTVALANLMLALGKVGEPCSGYGVLARATSPHDAGDCGLRLAPYPVERSSGDAPALGVVLFDPHLRPSATGERARFRATGRDVGVDRPCARYPLHFTTGLASGPYRAGNSRLCDAHARGPTARGVVALHPQLAARHGITQGCSVLIESRHDSGTFAALLSADVRPDMLFAPRDAEQSCAECGRTFGALRAIARLEARAVRVRAR